MNKNLSLNLRPTSLVSTIIYAGLVAGILDSAVAVVVYYAYFGLNPIQVLQFIASGVYGPSAIGGGAGMAVLGTCFHFLIALVCATVFALAYPRLKALRDFPATAGLLHGLGIWLVMNLLVLPFTNIPKSPFDLGLALIGIVWHMVLVGYPIALITRAYFEGERTAAGVAEARGSCA